MDGSTTETNVRDSEFDLTLTPRRDERMRRFVIKHNVGEPFLGSMESRFAVYRYPRSCWRFPWQRPRGGWALGRYIAWWSR